MTEEIKKIIREAKNICVIPSQNNEPESLTATLALFYTLKELGKNVNLITENFPEKFNFLVPSLDFISLPKNFVISIPRSLADVSQIYYEKNEHDLKIHLTVEKGQIKKEHIYFYFSDAKPDLIITLGIQDFQKELESKLDSFGFLLDAPLLNLDNQEGNKKFGAMNVIENKSLSEITLELIKSLDENAIKKDVANCILAGLIIHYENFKSKKTSPEIFEIAAQLIKKGADRQQIIENLYKTTIQEISFLGKIFQNLNMDDNNLSFSILDSDDFYNFGEAQAEAAIEKIKTIGIQNDLLVLWKTHASAPMIKGFFCSHNQNLIHKITESQKSTNKNGWVFISMPGSEINLAKDQIFKLII